MVTDKEIIEALKKVKDQYGLPFAKRLEQLYRNETKHFKSSNFLKTYSPGMEAASKIPPNYGWGSLKSFWMQFPKYEPTGLFDQAENTSELAQKRGVRTFVCFANIEAAMMSVAALIHLRKDNFGSWFANDQHPDMQIKYVKELDKIIPRMCKTFPTT